MPGPRWSAAGCAAARRPGSIHTGVAPRDRVAEDSPSPGTPSAASAAARTKHASAAPPVWTPRGALDAWIEHILAAADFAYENRLLWTPVWHPYSHYVHDPENRVLPALLEHCAGKPETFAFYTLRDVVPMLSVDGRPIAGGRDDSART